MKRSRRDFLTQLGLALGAYSLGWARPFQAVGQSRAHPRILSLPTAVRSVGLLTRTLEIAPNRWKLVVGHHSGVPTGNAAIYDRYHRSRGMENGLAYHFVIGNGTKSKDGEIEIGGRWKRQLPGGHVRSDAINQVGIGICLVGNFEETRPTGAQLHSFKTLVTYLKENVVQGPWRFAVHRDLDPGHTACPGRHFPIRKMHQRFG